MTDIELITKDIMGIVPAELGHGYFLFDSPPFETEFGYRTNAEPGQLTDTCWGICRNGVPLEFPVEDDYFGIAILDKNTQTLVQGYYTTLKIPSYEYISWYTAKDIIMPNRNLNLICFVGYYRPEEEVLHYTDYREFTIKIPTPPIEKILPWLFLLAIPLAIPLFKKFK